MDILEQLQAEITSIQTRNARVEKEKAWETSWQRHVSIAITTYAVMLMLFSLLDDARPFVNALLSTIGYLISVFSM
jgi:hypothetical protein